jgi:hypothetical protein
MKTFKALLLLLVAATMFASCTKDNDVTPLTTITLAGQKWQVNNIRPTHFENGTAIQFYGDIPENMMQNQQPWSSGFAMGTPANGSTANFSLLYNRAAIVSGLFDTTVYRLPTPNEWLKLGSVNVLQFEAGISVFSGYCSPTGEYIDFGQIYGGNYYATSDYSRMARIDRTGNVTIHYCTVKHGLLVRLIEK